MNIKKAEFSLTTILTLTTAVLIIIVIIVSNASIFSYMHEVVRENSTKSYRQIFNQANSQLQTLLQDIAHISAALSTDPEIIGAVNLALNATELSERIKNERYVQYLLKNAVGYHPYIDNAVIYINNRQILINEMQSDDYHNIIPHEIWFNEVLDKKHEHLLISGYKLRKTYFPGEITPTNREYCIYAIPFNDSVISRNPGILLISIDQQYIESFLKQTDYSDGRIILLLDENNQLIYSSEESFSRIDYNFFQLQSGSADSTINITGSDYFFVKQTNAFSGWNMVALIPVSVMYKDVYKLQRLLINGAVFAGILGIFLCAIISRGITTPFKALMESMNRVGYGDLSLIYKRSHIKEIHLLVKHYDNMLRQIDILIRQVKSGQQAKHAAELAALHSQINPHFTYNTLNSIQWVAKMQGAEKTAEMIALFSKLLRLTTSRKDEFITVEDELEQIGYYVDIMKLRYNCEIDFHYNISEQAKNARTLKLILQPLVENSFIHGFCNLEKSGNIDVQIFVENAMLFFVIKDDGVGFEANETAFHLPTPSSTQLHSGIGVANVNQRIQMWFGTEYGLSFVSSKGKGTLVTVTQPFPL